MSAAELTLSISEFKATCLDVLSRLNSGEFARVRILKRGKPFAEVVAPSAAEAAPFDVQAWRRDLEALSGWIPEGHDFTQPMMTDEEADQFHARVVQKVTGAPRDPNNMWS